MTPLEGSGCGGGRGTVAATLIWMRRISSTSPAFGRRVRAYTAANTIPLIFCDTGERKHLIAEEYLATHKVGRGVFMILVARAVAPTWKVTNSRSGVLVNLEKGPRPGHVVIKISSSPPFGCQVILNGHNYVAAGPSARWHWL